MSSTPEPLIGAGAWSALLAQARKGLPTAGARLRHPDSSTLVAAFALLALFALSVFDVPVWAAGPVVFCVVLALRIQHRRSLHGHATNPASAPPMEGGAAPRAPRAVPTKLEQQS